MCKLDKHRSAIQRGYIAMLAVDKDFRKKKIGELAEGFGLGLGWDGMGELFCAHVTAGSNLVKKAISQMIRSKEGCDEASDQTAYA